MAAQGSRNPQLEPTDPLYVHPSDNPSQPLVSTVFTGDNFDNWKRAVSIALSARHKLAFIDGSCDSPAPTSPLYGLWQRNNAMVLSWLLNSLNENIRNSVLYFDTAKALWEDLDGRFGQSNKARLFQVQKEFLCLTQGGLDIVTYCTKAKQLWDESRAVGGFPTCTCAKSECGVNGKLFNYSEEQRLIQFLMGLNGSYTAVRGSILMMTPFPTISQAYSILVQEERQRQVKNEQHFLNDNASFSVTTPKTTRISRKPEGRRSTLFCDHCKRPGHTMDRCYKIHGYPSKTQSRGRGGYNQSYNRKAYNTWIESTPQDAPANQLETQTAALPGLNPEQSKQLYQFLTNLTSNNTSKSGESEVNTANMAGILSSLSNVCSSSAICLTCQLGNETWIIDSGASDHMSYDARFLHDLRLLDTPIYVSLLNGQKVQVTHYGTLQLNSRIQLQHVLLVPHFKYNLLSVKQLARQLHCDVVFSETLCTLQGPSLKRPVVVGKEAFGLYLLEQSKMKGVQFVSAHTSDLCNSSPILREPFNVSCNQSSRSISVDTWHKRMGHMPPQKLKLLPIDIIVPTNSEHMPCDVCPRAKQQRLPFHLSVISSCAPFELIHVDTWGPYHTKTYSGHRFFLTIVDDYTRTTWTHLMVTKDEAVGLIKAFVITVETQFSHLVKTIRSDNALEFTKSNEMLELFVSKGILHQTSCVQTPQQNGVVERKHKRLLEVSRALLFQSKLPLRF